MTQQKILVFSAAEYRSRWRKVEREMVARNLDVAVIWGKNASSFDRAGDIIYLTNYMSTKVGQGYDSGSFNARAYCAVILQVGQEPFLIADDPDIRPDVVSVSGYLAASDPVAATVDKLNDLGISGSVAFVGTDFFPMKYWKQLQDLTPDVDWIFHDDLVRSQRLVKSDEECDVIRKAGRIASGAMTRMMEALISGETEANAAALAAHDIVASGGVVDKIQISHGETVGYTCGEPLSGYRTVAPTPGDLVRAFLIGPMLQGYYLDPGRTAIAGNKPDREQAELVEACAGIVESIAECVKPGVSYYDAAAIGDKMTKDFGSDPNPAAEKFPFFGHPHGLYFEGPPYISTVLAHNGAVFEKGMLIGIEAFLARDGVGNAGFEQNYIVTQDGLELITDTPMLWH